MHNNKIMYYTHPKVIPWGWTNKQTDKRRDKYYSIFSDKLSLPDGSLDIQLQATHEQPHYHQHLAKGIWKEFWKYVPGRDTKMGAKGTNAMFMIKSEK